MDKMIFEKILIFFLLNLFYFNIAYSEEPFTFNVTEIEIIEQGNIFLGRKGGNARTNNGITIEAENFKYDKVKNILFANTKVKIQDKLNDIILYTDEITYNKNEEIIITKGNSKAVKSNNEIIINAKSFKYRAKENILFANTKVKVQDKLNDIILYTDEITYNKNDDIIITKNNSELIKNKITIKANNFNFKRKLNIIEAKKNVEIVDKLNDYFGEGERLKYFINLEKIQTFGTTNAKIESTYNFNGSNVTLLRNENELYSYKKSRIIDGDLSQYELDEFIYYFKDQFLKGKNIIFTSDISATEDDQEVAKFSDGFFDLKNKSYKASDTSLNIKKNTFDNSKNDPRIKGVSSESKNGITKINKAIFTSCEIRNNKCPPWSIKAKEIMHDKNKKQLIYNHATLQVYDKPVMYFPKFFHPDPSVERQNGFLKPQLNNSDILGSSLFIPYFQIISESKDVTFKPTIFDNNIQMYQSEYRQENLNSSFIADFNHVKGYKSKSLNKKNSINHFFSKYEVNLNFKEYLNSFASFFIEKTNNDTYLKIFDSNLIDIDKKIKPKNNSTLHSGTKLELDHNDFNFSAGMDVYENLSIGNSSDKYQYVLPYFNFSKNISSNENWAINFSSNGSNKLTNTNNLRSRVINDLHLSTLDFYSDYGFKNDINMYFKNLNSLGKNDSKYKSRPSMEIASIYEASSSLPLKKINQKSIEYLEPKISFRVNPGDMQNNNATKRIVNTDNVFDINRIGSSDTFEAGKSLTLGVNYKKEYSLNDTISTNEINNFFEFNTATVLRDKKENYVPKSSTLDMKNSNIFGSIKNHYYSKNELSFIDFLKFDYYFSLDNDFNNLEYNSFKGEVAFDKLITSFNFIEENGPIGDTNTLENSIKYKFDEFNYISFNTRRNRKINLTEYYDLLYEYKNDCLTAGIKYKKTYYQDRDLKPAEDLMLTFTFYPLTTYEQEIDQNLYRD